MQKILFLLTFLGLLGFQMDLNAQAPVLQKNDFFSNSKLRTWYGFNTSHSIKVLDVERVISENEFKELKTLRPFLRDTLNFRVLITDTDGIQKIVNVSLVLSSEFMVAVETWNTACGFPNGRIIIYIEGGITKYHVFIWRNSDGVKVFEDHSSNTRFEKLDLKADGYKVRVDDSNTPVQNNYTLFNAEVKASSAPVLSITRNPEHCKDGKGSIQASAQSGVGPYEFKLMNTGEKNNTGKFVNLKSGTYSIQVSDANFCTDVESVLILNHCDSILSKQILQKTTCDSIKSLKLDTVESGKAWGTNTDSFTVVKYNFIPKFIKIIFGNPSCNHLDTGLHFVGKFSNIYGCDSLVYKMVGYAPKGVFTFDTIKTVCISDSGRVEVFKGKSSAGCDSTYTKSWNYIGIQTIYMPTRDTCNASPDKVDTVKSKVCLLSDSIYYVTHFRVLPKDTILTKKSWCKARASETRYFKNQFGCESVEIISFSVKPLDTVFVTKDTCYKGSKNSYLSVLKTTDGFCDSIVLITLNVLKTDTIRDSLYVCGLKISKQSKQIIKNHLGCDSLTILVDSLAPPAILRSTVFRYSCDPDSVKQGTYYDTTRFDYGCIKSIVTLRLRDAKTTSNLSDTVLINQNIDTIIFVSKTFVNQYNCDSIVNRKWIYDKAEVYWVPDDSTNCGFKPSETILVQKLKTYYGSDSTVKQKLITFESPKGKIDNFSHVPAPGQKGFIETSATGGKLPYNWEWNTGETSSDIYNLSGGNYVLTITDANGCKDTLERGIAYFRAWSDTRGVLTVGCGLADQSHFVDYGSQFGHLIVYDVNGTKLYEIHRVDMSVENIFTIPISAKGKVIVMMYFDSDATPLKDSSVSF